MDISEIKASLDSRDSQDRLRALTALREYEPDVVVPLLKAKLRDPEFLVRSFVAMGLGRKQRADAFEALIDMLETDRDHNVRAEAANSLSLYGEAAIPHLVEAFLANDHWLIRRSIIAALMELSDPEALFKVCLVALNDQDLTVQESSIDCLGFLANSSKSAEALQQLLLRVNADWWRVRLHVAKSLKPFNAPEAKAALQQLRQDEDHRVVGAAMEALL